MFRFPGVRTLVTYSLVGSLIAGAYLGGAENEDRAAVRKLSEYAVVFFFGAASARRQDPPSGGQS